MTRCPANYSLPTVTDEEYDDLLIAMTYYTSRVQNSRAIRMVMLLREFGEHRRIQMVDDIEPGPDLGGAEP